MHKGRGELFVPVVHTGSQSDRMHGQWGRLLCRRKLAGTAPSASTRPIDWYAHVQPAPFVPYLAPAQGAFTLVILRFNWSWCRPRIKALDDISRPGILGNVIREIKVDRRSKGMLIIFSAESDVPNCPILIISFVHLNQSRVMSIKRRFCVRRYNYFVCTDKTS